MNRTIMFSLALVLLAPLGLTVAADEAPERPKPRPEPKPEEKSAEVELPWTAEDIRKGWGKGVSFLLDVESGTDKGWLRWEAENITDKGFDESEIECKNDAPPRFGKARQRTWDKHLSNLKQELAGAVKSKGEVEVPYGKLACDIYTITKKEGTQKVALSAKVPGMVVMMEVEGEGGEKRQHEKFSLRSIDPPVCQAPWNFDKIAENFKAGTKTVYAGKSSEGDARIEYVVDASNITGMTFTATESQGGSEPKKAEPATTTWDAYLRYFVPPRYDTKTSEEKLKTPAGEFECVVFAHVTESNGARASQKVWLAKNEPGLMVRCEVEHQFGEQKMFYNMELTEFVKGK
ncbi:MAG: hypothetical protein HPKKFMNG_00441 [Planctomycetes bacterium]|nr:hypothetical protein [Planctomycetota bacterium]HRJ78423.1 hypothetical protein [Planctomycetota bacterium]